MTGGIGSGKTEVAKAFGALGVEVVDGRQYFVAEGDFPEPIGPAFWERP